MLFKLIRSGRFHFDSPYWDKISESYVLFVSSAMLGASVVVCHPLQFFLFHRLGLLCMCVNVAQCQKPHSTHASSESGRPHHRR